MTENGSPSQYKPNVLNQYDIGDGEMLQYGDEHELVYYDGNTYSYIGDTRLETVNGANRLGQMENIEYKLGYDALGRCVKRVTDGHAKFFAYDGEKAILEFDENGQYIANTLYGRQMDEVLARDNNGSGQYFMQDRNLNTVVVTGGDGSVVESYRYDAFGAPTFYHYNVDGTVTADDKTQINNRFLFTGREWNGNFGFYEYRARAYHPMLGRFMSEDPKGFDAGDYNLYRYVRNDPWDLTDPSGQIVDTILDIGFIAYDLYSVAKNPSRENFISLGLDTAGAALPGVTGLGVAYRASRLARGAEGALHAAEAVNKAREVNKARDAAKILTPEQAANLRRFEKKLPTNATETSVRELPNGSRAFQSDSAAKNIPGSQATYEKQVDAAGNTVQMTKTTYGPNGEIVHVKDKMTGEVFEANRPARNE